MDVRELRIGNFVHNNVESFQIQAKDLIFLLAFDNEHYANPIPLTEEWLERFGGISDEPSTPFFIIKMPRNLGEIRVNPDNNMTWLRHWTQPAAVMNPESLVYVHQLQNLYFVLSGTELEVK